MMDYLKSTLGMDVKAYVGTDYTATIEAMKAKKVDAAYFGPFSYVLATRSRTPECSWCPAPPTGSRPPTTA